MSSQINIEHHKENVIDVVHRGKLAKDLLRSRLFDVHSQDWEAVGYDDLDNVVEQAQPLLESLAPERSRPLVDCRGVQLKIPRREESVGFRREVLGDHQATAAFDVSPNRFVYGNRAQALNRLLGSE